MEDALYSRRVGNGEVGRQGGGRDREDQGEGRIGVAA